MGNFSRLIVDYNSTANLTSSSNVRTYITATSSSNLLILTLTMSTVALIGTVANSIMVILTKKESKYDGPIEEKKRRALLFFLIYNLSLADLMASLFSSTSLAVQQYLRILQSSYGCYGMRLLQYLFPTLSTQLLAVICLERYVSLVWPFRSFPIVGLTRKIVKCTWVSAIFWSFVISFSFKTFTINFENGSHYTLDCAQDLKSPDKKAVYITALFFSLLLPALIICLTTTRSALLIRKFKKSLVQPTPRNPGSDLTEKKVRSICLVIWLVVIFGATCFPFILYQVVKSIVGQRVSYSADFIIRYGCAILVLSNGVINPVMYYKNLKSIRWKMIKFLRKSRRHNTVNVHTFTYENVTYKPESLQLQVPRVSLFEGRGACGTLDTISADGFASYINRPSSLSNFQLSVGSCP